MSASTSELTARQTESLNQLKTALADVLEQPHGRVQGEPDDDFLLRWLRARAFDVRKAERMYRDSLEWRKQNKVDTILEDFQPPEVIMKYYPGGICGYDKQGRPIFVIDVGQFDPKGLLKSATKESFQRFQIFYMEYILKHEMPTASERVGKPVNSCTFLFDVKHYGIRHMYRPMMEMDKEFNSLCEANYPEFIAVMFVLHAPSIFNLAMKIFRPFIDEVTFSKIQILGKDYIPTLLRHMDAEQFPAKYGGTMTDPDGNPDCITIIKQGGIVPPEYYLTPSVELVNATVRRASSLKLQLQVPQVGMVIRWQFVSDDRDIGFGIFRRTSETQKKTKDMITVQETRRVNSQLACEKGYLVCAESGNYIFRFDNTYSWTRSKRVRYFVAVYNSVDEGADDVPDNDVDQVTDLVTDDEDKELLRKAAFSDEADLSDGEGSFTDLAQDAVVDEQKLVTDAANKGEVYRNTAFNPEQNVAIAEEETSSIESFYSASGDEVDADDIKLTTD